MKGCLDCYLNMKKNTIETISSTDKDIIKGDMAEKNSVKTSTLFR